MVLHDVNPQDYAYLDPLWPVLENHPDGISLKQAVKRSGLDEKTMLKTIEKLAMSYNRMMRKHMSKGFIQSLVQKALDTNEPNETWVKEIVKTWACDKVMLYNRIKELNCEDRLMGDDEYFRIKELWLESKGM